MKFPVSAVLFALSCGIVESLTAKDHAVRHEFIEKMNQAVGQKQHEARINRMLLRAAKPMNQPEFMRPRILDEEEEAAEGDDAQQQQDGDDQVQEEEDAQEEEEDQQQQDYDYAIDLGEYALKYVGCSNIHTYSEELAQDEDATSILEMNRFVVLRLCPKDECSNYYEYGCTSGYGDYLIDMEEYLQIMSETYFSQYVEYCETCYSCLHPNANDDGNANNNNNNNGYYGWNDYAQDDDAGGNCRYSDVCMNYWTVCKDYSAGAYQLEEYFECSQLNMGGSYSYLGPHCGSDGKTIGIGVYSDANCNDYKKDLEEVSSYLDMELDDGYLKPFHSDKCISCLASDGNNLDAYENDGSISGVCNGLYGAAAKCNKYMGNDGDINSDVQEDNEETVCSFIHNIMTQSYDEYGEIYLGRGGLVNYVKYVSQFNNGQQWALTFCIFLVVALGAYAVYLHKQVKKNKFAWRPRLGYSNDPYSKTEEVGREHSGIISGRSYENSSGMLA